MAARKSGASGRGRKKRATDPVAALRKARRVGDGDLRWQCPRSAVPKSKRGKGDTTIGQERAVEALRLGLDVRAPGYNVFVCGLSGTGRTRTVLQMIQRLAPSCPIPRDRAFVHCFEDPHRPRLLTMPAGTAAGFRADMRELVAFLRKTLPSLLEDREFHRRRDDLLKEYAGRERELFDKLRRRLGRDGFALVEIAGEDMKRLEIFPLFGQEPVPLDKYKQLAAEGKVPVASVDKKEAGFLEHRRELAQVLRRGRGLAREMNEKIGGVLREAAESALGGAFEDLRARYPEDGVGGFLDGVREDVLAHLVGLAREAQEDDESETRFRLYEVNVIVDRRSLEGCPVVSETAPTVAGVFGTIERRPIAPGMFVADHTMIRGGSLLESDGGYLVLDLEDVLAEPAVWVNLRRVLKHRRLEIRAADRPVGLPGIGLSPQAIDLDVKVILVGDWRLYEALYNLDRDFAETFRVKVDFEPDMNADRANVRNFCLVAQRIAREEGLLPLDVTGLAAIAEFGVRTTGRQGKITTRFSEIAEVVREADFWSRQSADDAIAAAHVERALEHRDDRNRLAETRIHDLIDREVLLIDTDGPRVGRVNGLSVYDLGYYAFGKPTVITASTGVGQAGIINVEREANLSGGIYDKGVLIIAGYLRRTFAQRRPLALTASVCFEQSYSGVDGDSASVAEVAALLSELSGIPVDQGIAVTGSLNQHGEVQPIGGVNQKVEGFFAVCARRGLTGRQGVVIPASNVGELMLSDEVVAACAKGRFHLWAVDRVEDAVSLLLGQPAGKRLAEGGWEEGSVYALTDARLAEYVGRLSDGDDWKPLPLGTGVAPKPAATPPTAPTPPAPPAPPRPPARPTGRGRRSPKK